MIDPSRPISIDALLLGKVRPYTRPGSTSAIDKRPAGDRVRIELLGLVGDEQADPRVHGGPDKAVHHYPFDHYAPWREELGDRVAPGRLDAPAAFGENLSSSGLAEDDDVSRLGNDRGGDEIDEYLGHHLINADQREP